MDEAPVNIDLPVPGTFRLLGAAQALSYERGVLTISAGKCTDWFVDPGSGEVNINAPALVVPLVGDYTLSASVEVDLLSTFDAAALVLWSDDHRWAKLALERSPDGEVLVVSVVTRGESDDANSVRVDGGRAFLRVASIGAAHAFHTSSDGIRWRFVRHFRLGCEPAVGFETQSPNGDGCTAHFSEIVYKRDALGDLRNGV